MFLSLSVFVVLRKAEEEEGYINRTEARPEQVNKETRLYSTSMVGIVLPFNIYTFQVGRYREILAFGRRSCGDYSSRGGRRTPEASIFPSSRRRGGKTSAPPRQTDVYTVPQHRSHTLVRVTTV